MGDTASPRPPGRDEPDSSAKIIDSAGYAIVAESLDGIVVTWNKAAEALYGYAAAEMIGRPATVLIPADRIDEERDLLERVRGGDGVTEFETFRRRKDGRELHLALSVTAIRDRAGAIIGVTKIARDITKRRRAEAVLRASEARFAAMFHQAVVGVTVLDTAGRFLMANQHFCDILGRTEAELLRLRIADVTHPEDRAANIRMLRTLLAENQSYVIDKRYVRPDGSIVWVNVAASLIADPETGERQILGVVQDITERKEAELALLRLNETLEQRVEQRTREREMVKQQLHQAQKMEAIGQLTGGVAHDFNNLLTIIGGNLELLERLVGRDDPRAGKLVETALRGVERAEKLIEQLLAFARRQSLRPRTVDLAGILAESAELVAHAVGNSISVCYRRQRNLLRCRVDPAQFQAAVLNLSVNARDAMPEGGELVIETRNIDLDAAQAARLSEIGAGAYVGVSVSDTGGGIAPELLDRIFEPFFTTKTVGKGTGLGLAQVYGFVRQSGGAITVDSEVGRGTTIQILLPAVAEAGGIPNRSERPHSEHPAASAADAGSANSAPRAGVPVSALTYDAAVGQRERLIPPDDPLAAG
ncbi:MAG: PAS domain S-box protein [Alphaproteobacteria bacterium]